LLFVAVPYADAIGLTPNTIRILARLLRDRPRAGGAITYGVQRIGGSYDELRELLAAEDLETRPLEADEIVVDPFAERGERVHQDTFFRMLGYSAVHSIDFVEDEHPTYRLDLNEPIPDELRASYDLGKRRVTPTWTAAAVWAGWWPCELPATIPSRFGDCLRCAKPRV